ncbi:hypothetical protein, partial [Burkholderia ambifaria]|uniref:hypothetical protein n=1 Tax=Burkholderia ambifaria TaxID=152480 RepID=UPI001ABBBA86
VSRGLKVDAAVRAKKLVAIAHQGTAAIEQSNRQTLSGSASGKAPAALIDVSAKTGVRIAGTVDADTVDVSGRLDNDGSVRGRSVRIAGDATNSGTLHAEKVLAMGNVTNGGTIEAGDVQVMGNTTNNGTLHGDDSVSVMGRLYNGLSGVTSSYG